MSTKRGCPVMYRCYDADGRLIYVGSTARWGQRLGEHRKDSWWFPLFKRLETESHPTLEAARAAEATAIQEEQPAFNWRDTGRTWLGRRDGWTAADHALHTRWAEERGVEPTALVSPGRPGRVRPAPPAGGSYYVAS